jgi:hypothetical protein
VREPVAKQTDLVHSTRRISPSQMLAGTTGCRLLAHLYGPAVRCKPNMTDQEIIGLAHLYSAL